jgi:two-component system sensor histidine kinase AgrC
VYDKYNTTLNSLKEYEDILDKYRISTHENKNQLLTIRNMLPKTNKKIISYIDKIVENKLKDNDKIIAETTKIPAGGLRGLIYSKILLMEELNIKHELFVSKEVKTVDLINKIDDYTMLDVCKIIGVYLDNSIQAVEKIKLKYISIIIDINNNFVEISISNNYKGKIELDLLELKGYTSKNGNHGYGLTLAKEIIDKNKKLSNEKFISKNIFTQKLKIKM